ncbi:SRPBCC family protein [Gracilibacillus suaedae]|uniref:SRPBCC family protein n=1 Tax=Gracilibacillus suaedae TaxID=2820273 RepID=UPI001E48D8F6|nr:SRPBCC family protein [Gracilibacillus suaedae]
MKNITKMKILKPTHEVFEAFVDPLKIGNFWFSSSSERWEQGKTITLRYDEYDAKGDIEIIEVVTNKKLVFKWNEGYIVTITLEELNNSDTIIQVIEEGFNENDDELILKLVDNKEGWVYMLTCLKGYLEYGVNLRVALVK